MSLSRTLFSLCFLGFCSAHGQEAKVTVQDGTLQTSGLSDVTMPPNVSGLVVEGPEGGIDGLASPKEPAAIKGRLDAPLAGQGSLMFWFRADQAYRSGNAMQKLKQKLVELPGVMTVSFRTEKEMVTISADWADGISARGFGIQLPEFPGGEWHHFALRWNSAQGGADVFLDGTEFYLEEGKRISQPIPEATTLEVFPGRIALADVRVSTKEFQPADLASLVGGRQGGLDALLGAKALAPFSPEAGRGELLYENALASAEDIKDWKLEGPGVIEFADGWMQMRSSEPNAEGPMGHFVLWCPKDFPENFQAEWDIEILGENGLCIVFFAARGQDGQDAFDPALAPRNGIFKQYTKGEINCYHISYYAHAPESPRPTANLRKNHGFFLVSNGPAGIQPAEQGKGKTHRAVLRKKGAHIRMAVDDRTIIDFTDDGQRAGAVLEGGKIGLRQMKWTVARYRNFRVYALKP